LQIVVVYDNKSSDDPNPTNLAAESRIARFSRVPRRSAGGRRTGAINRRTRREGRYGEAIKGVEGGIFEIALRHRGDAFRVIYAVRTGATLWVIHAFQKKSKSGIKTPQTDINLINERLKRLKEALK
jgi:phage-related protein